MFIILKATLVQGIAYNGLLLHEQFVSLILMNDATFVIKIH